MKFLSSILTVAIFAFSAIATQSVVQAKEKLSKAEVRAAFAYAAAVTTQKNTYTTAPATATPSISTSVGKIHNVGGKFYKEDEQGWLIPCPDCNAITPPVLPVSYSSAENSCPCVNSPATVSRPTVYVQSQYSTPAATPTHTYTSGSGCGVSSNGYSSEGGCGLFRSGGGCGLFKGLLCAPFRLLGGCR